MEEEIISFIEDSNGNSIELAYPESTITFNSITIEDIPYGESHDLNYYEEPYFDTKDVTLENYEYKLDLNSILEQVWEFMSKKEQDETLKTLLDDLDDDEKFLQYIIDKKFIEKYSDSIVKHFEEAAKEDAYEVALEEANN